MFDVILSQENDDSLEEGQQILSLLLQEVFVFECLLRGLDCERFLTTMGVYV